MAQLNERPIVFPLSNPVRLSECTFEDALVNTDGRVLFASGSPFQTMEYNEKPMYPGQGNNMYIFPGLGLGSILARSTSVTDTMVEAASLGLANALNQDERDLDMLYPRLDRIREISGFIARDVIRAAQKAGVDRSIDLSKMNDEQLLDWVKSKMWVP